MKYFDALLSQSHILYLRNIMKRDIETKYSANHHNGTKREKCHG